MNFSLFLRSTGVAALLATGACAHTWMGVKPPTPQTLKIGQRPGPIVLTQNLSSADIAITKLAISEIESVIASELFLTKLNAQTWRTDCTQDGYFVDGIEILSDLTNNTLPVSLKKKNSVTGNAITNWGKNIASNGDVSFVSRMIIDPDRFDNWHDDRQSKANMINTLIHETTHLVPNKSAYEDSFQGFWTKYSDEGWNNDTCLQSTLVSYAVGNIAEDVWLELNPE